MAAPLRGGLGRSTIPTVAVAESCPWCGSENLFTVLCEQGLHYARTGCSGCGRHLRWESRPITPEDAPNEIMPFGRYRGVPLGEIDRSYLRWARDNAGLHGRLAAAVALVLDGGGQE